MCDGGQPGPHRLSPGHDPGLPAQEGHERGGGKL